MNLHVFLLSSTKLIIHGKVYNNLASEYSNLAYSHKSVIIFSASTQYKEFRQDSQPTQTPSPLPQHS